MYKKRIQAISENLASNEAALISNGFTRRYLTGFPSSAGVVLITPKQSFFIIDFRYIEKAQKSVSSCEVILQNKLHEQLKELLDTAGIEKLYVETERLDVASLLNYRKNFAPITVSDEPFLDKLLTEMRAIKTADELELMRKAQELTDKTFEYIINFIKPGLTEKQIALEMEFFMRKLGSEGIAFDIIAVSGANSSLPHGVPTDKKIQDGDFITMDFGAAIGGYCSDMTRTVAVGYATDEQREVYDTVLRAQLAALDAMRAGIIGKDADAVARNIIADAGFGEYFGHSLGHSVGLEIHEAPNCSPTSEAVMKEGTIMTVEPGIYLPDKFGVRIEDMVYITETGCINLTASPKELIIL